MSDLTAPITTSEPEPESITPPLEPVALEPEAAPEPTSTTNPQYVPLPALHAAREEVRQLKEQLAAASSAKSEVETLRQQMAQLQARIPEPKEPETPPVQLLPDDQADALARTLQLFDAQGQPDRTAARNAAGIMAAMAKTQAQEAVAPIVALSAAERAQQFRQKAGQVTDADGQMIDPALLDRMWQAVPPEITASNPQVAAILTYAAAGYQRMHGKKPPAPAPNAPVVSERAGGRVEGTHTLSDFELAHLHRSGQKASDYVASLKNYRPGLPTILE